MVCVGKMIMHALDGKLYVHVYTELRVYIWDCMYIYGIV